MVTDIKSLIAKDLDKWLLTVLTGTSLFYVLFVFKGYGIQPGLSYSVHNLLIRAFEFGILTSFVFYLFEFNISKGSTQS